MKPIATLALLLWATTAQAAMYSVKVVKTAAGRCTAPPTLQFIDRQPQWKLVNAKWHSGENDWEIFFNLEGPDAPPKGQPLPTIVINHPGVKIARAIVGKTDVPFNAAGDNATSFTLVPDTSRGQLMQVDWKYPKDGRVISFIHNWEMRKNEQYLSVPWPAKQVAAVPNYLLATAEVLRQMGNMGPGGAEKKFDGEIVLMGSEVAATRGHMDFPQHIHIMHYEHPATKPGDYASRLVPHFYMNDEGVINRNSFAVLAGRGKSAELGIDDVCRFEDSSGHFIMDLIVTADALVLRRSLEMRKDYDIYKLKGDPKLGPSGGVWAYKDDKPVCRAECHDDPEHGRFTITLDIYEAGQLAETFRSGYEYDPFTAKVKRKLP